MTPSTKKIDLSFNKKAGDRSAARPKGRSVANLFHEDESDDETCKQKRGVTASERFDQKYSAGIRPRDQRMIDKVVAENPDIYEYDQHYDKIEQQKNQKFMEQKLADEEKKPKYAHNIINAYKKRELRKLIHDEHVYKKERVAEGDEFDKKETFITSAYKKQIEEREEFRKEMERQDAIDELTNVKDQKMWQQAFNRKMLEDRTRTYGESVPPSLSTTWTESEPKIKSEPTEFGDETSSPKEQRELRIESESTKGHNKERDENETGKSAAIKQREERRDRDDTHRRFSALRKTDQESAELEERMKKIRLILTQRNDEKSIGEMRERYVKRLADGIIVPPVRQAKT